MDAPLRPLSLGELLDRTFSLYRRYFPLFVGIAVFPYLGMLAVSLLFSTLALTTVAPNLLTATPAVLMTFAGAEFCVALVGLIALGLAAGGTVFAVAAVYLGQTITIGQALRQALRRLLPLVIAALVLDILALFGTILLIVPGVLVVLVFALTFPAIALESLGPLAGMRRSAFLTKGFRLRILAVIALFGVIMMAISSCIDVVAALAVGIQGMAHGSVVFVNLAIFGGFLVNVLVIPVLTIALALFYFDLRVRKEAFDIQLLLQRAEHSTPAMS